MNIKGGALSFEATLDNEQLIKAFEEMKKRIQGVSNAVVESGDIMDETTKEIAECYEIQKEVVVELEKEVQRLNEEFENLGPGQSQEKIIEQSNRAKQELESEREGLVFLEKELERARNTNISYSNSLEETRKVLGEVGGACTQLEDSLQELEIEYNRLGKASANAFMTGNDKEHIELKRKQEIIKQEIRLRESILKELREQSDALENHTQKIDSEKKKIEENVKAQISFRTQLHNVREELLQMEQSGAKATDPERYRALQEEAGRLAGAISNVNKQTQVLGHNQSALQGVISAISGVSGAFSAAQGALGLFAGKNEDLQKIMVKVQSLMAITIGLQQVSQVLHEKSAFRLVVLAKAQQLVATSSLFLGKSFIKMGLSATAAKIAVAGLYATLTMGLSLAIAGIVHLINKYNQKQEEEKRKAEEVAEAHKKQQERLESLAKSYAEQVALITTLRNALKNETLSYNDKLKVIKKLQDIIPDYNAKISKEGDIIWENKAAIDAYLVSLEKTLKFKAAMEDLTEIYKEIYQLEKNTPKEPAGKTAITLNGQSFDTWDVDKLAQANGLKNATDVPPHIIEQWKKQAETFNQFSKDIHTKRMEELNSQVSEIQKYVQNNNLIDLTSGKTGGSDNKKDPFIEHLAERKKQYDLYFKWINSKDEIIQKAAKTEFEGLLKEGSSYLDYLKRQREQILYSVEGSRKEVGERMIQTFGNGNVNLLARPLIDAAELVKKGWEDAGEGIATVFSSQYGILDKEGKELEILVTPILPDGTVLSPEELEDYIYNDLQGANNILSADKKGIVISVGVDSDGKAGDILHQLQEQYYATNKLSTKQKEVLHKLNDAIATETKETVLGEFEKELQSQLTGARSILEMLNILEERRKQLAGDGSEMDTSKTQILDKAQEDVAKKAEDETKNLLKQYAGYLSEKINFDLEYGNRKKVLNEALAKATTEEERRIALAALEGLENDRKKYAKSSGNEDYDKLVEEYRSFEQKKADISEEYDEKIALATAQKNEELVERLTQAKNKALSSAALEELQNSGVWEKLFSNLDDLTTRQIEELIAKIEGQKAQLGIELDPKDLEAILKKLDEAKEEIRSRNPFKALKDAIKDYGKAADSEAKKKSLTAMFNGVAGSLDLVKGAFDSVVGGLADMGLAGDEVTQGLLGDISKMVGSASELATGIATGNPLSIIQGSVGLISSAFDVFNSRDRKAERAIRKHAEAVKELESAYNALAWEVDRALGSTVYDNQKALISNLEQQQRELESMWKAEESKKKTDKNKVKEYQERYEEAGRKIKEVMEDIANDITQTSAKDLANQLGDALVEAFGKGEDAAKSFEKVATDAIKNAVLNQLKKNFLELQLDPVLKQLQKDMGFDEKGGGSWNELTAAEQQRFKNSISAIGSNFAEAMKLYEDLFKELEEDSDPTTSLSGAIKGASQESIDLLAGQTNAVRVNQVEGNEIMRSQLLHLASIDAKVGVSNSYLASIDSKLSNNNSDPLRAQGIIN